MHSIGLDLTELERIEQSMKNPRFCRRVLGKEEYSQLQRRGFPVESVAASFCAKEAFAKAMGTGVRGFCLAEVQLLREENGKPYLRLSGGAKKLAKKLGYTEFSVSVTHSRAYASAVVLAQRRMANGTEL